jgi:hypothetical protein
MKLLFWRKEPAPEPAPEPPWAGRTPTADMLELMFAQEWSATEIVWVIRVVELRRRIAELETLVTELKTAQTKAGLRDTSAMPDKPRVAKPPVVTRNNSRNHATRPKRSRAKYMRGYRAKLKLVTRDGDAA